MSTTQGKLHRQQQLGAHAQALRCHQLGVQFRRRVVLHGFIVDFFAPAARLVVEVDGAQHTRQRGADKRQDAALAAAGLLVVRLPARLVLRRLPVALLLVAQVLSCPQPS